MIGHLDENPDMHFNWDGGKFLPISSQVYYDTGGSETENQANGGFRNGKAPLPRRSGGDMV